MNAVTLWHNQNPWLDNVWKTLQKMVFSSVDVCGTLNWMHSIYAVVPFPWHVEEDWEWPWIIFMLRVKILPINFNPRTTEKKLIPKPVKGLFFRNT